MCNGRSNVTMQSVQLRNVRRSIVINPEVVETGKPTDVLYAQVLTMQLSFKKD